MRVRDFDFDLPPDLIAQAPPAERGDSRLLCLSRATGAVTHGAIADLPGWLRPGDVLVVNDTKVFPARLLGRRLPGGGRVECLLTDREPGVGVEDQARDQRWTALVRPGPKLRTGARLVFDGPVALHGEVGEARPFGRRLVRLWTEDGQSVDEAIDAAGHVPLPPYIKRPDARADRDRYQTVFAHHRGSVAAPTAGLHFTPRLLEALRAAGVETATITLHVGYGTFQPVRVEDVEDHHLESERYAIGEATAAAVNAALADGRRVVAVGTTVTRTLESVARDHGGRIEAGAGATDLFIYPGFAFRVVGGLLTNFHVPRSSLLMLVSAFGGVDTVRRAYREAVARRYRFYSYGDAMLVL